jgi:serine/threonine-protein kinase
VEIVLQACKAVAEAHALGIVHRDIKPSNLFLTRRSDGSRRVVLLDFGISKRAVPAGEGGFAPELTRAQLVAGSPFYMSPEQVRGLAHTDSRTDIWSLGVVLYELLTCRRPFDGEEHGAICAQIAADAPAPPCAYRPDLPTGLDAVVLRCLEKSPERRFSGVDEFMLALLPFGRAGASSVIGTMAQLPGSKTLVLADSRGVMGGTVVDAECSSGGAPATHVAISSTSAAWRAPRIVSFKRASALALVMMTIGVPAFGALVLGSSGPNARAREASVELPAPVPHLPDPGEAPWSGPLPVPDRQTGVALEAATSRREHPPPPKTLRMGDAGRAGAIAGVISTVKAAPRQIEASPQPPPPLPPEPRPDPLSAE